MKQSIILYDDLPKARAYGHAAAALLAELKKRPNIKLIPYNPSEHETPKNFDLLLSWAISQHGHYPSKIVYLPHGISPWKGTRFRHRISHYLCCAKYEVGKYFSVRRSTHDVVGWPKLDELVQNVHKKKKYRETLIKKYSLDPKLPIITYIPTYTYPGETRLLTPTTPGARKNLLCRRGTLRRMKEPGFPEIPNMILAPHHADLKHSATKPIIDSFDRVYTGNKNPLLLGCDLIIGDISSVLIESLAIDIPIVHLTNGNEEIFRIYFNNRNSPLCYLGPYTHNPKHLPKLIDECLHTNKHTALRHQWRDKFIYLPKGTASVAAADALERLAKK